MGEGTSVVVSSVDEEDVRQDSDAVRGIGKDGARGVSLNLNSNINKQVAGIGYSKSDPIACGSATLIEDGANAFNKDNLGVWPDFFWAKK